MVAIYDLPPFVSLFWLFHFFRLSFVCLVGWVCCNPKNQPTQNQKPQRQKPVQKTNNKNQKEEGLACEGPHITLNLPKPNQQKQKATKRSEKKENN